MKVSELSGALLDYWVAKAEGIEHPPHLREMAPGCVLVPRELASGGVLHREWVSYQPSEDWGLGGPIIERFDGHTRVGGLLIAKIGGKEYQMIGDTLLIAAMRAYVASKFGEIVPDETRPR